MRRRFHLALVLAVVLVTSGCTLPGADLTADASAVSVNDSVLDATGYSLDTNATIGFNQTIGINGKDHEVGVKNRITTYENPEDERHFVVFSTPSPDTEGAPVNPFANRSEYRDIGRMLGSVNNTSALTVENRQNVTMVGHRTQLVTYATTNHTSVGTTPVFVSVAVAQDAGDAVVAVGVRPQSATDANTTKRLIENINHGGSA